MKKFKFNFKKLTQLPKKKVITYGILGSLLIGGSVYLITDKLKDNQIVSNEQNEPIEDSSMPATIVSNGIDIRNLSTVENEDGTIVKKISYTITPSNASYQEIKVACSFIDNTSCSSYVTAKKNDGENTINITCLKPFSKKVVVKISCLDNESINASITVDYLKKIVNIEYFNSDDGYYDDLIESLTTLSESEDELYTCYTTYSEGFTIDANYKVKPQNFKFTINQKYGMDLPWDWEEDNADTLLANLFSEKFNTEKRKPTLAEIKDTLRCIDNDYLYSWYRKYATISFGYSCDIVVDETNQTFHLADNVWSFEFRFQYTSEEIATIYTKIDNVSVSDENIIF